MDDKTAQKGLDEAEEAAAGSRTELVSIGVPEGSGQGNTLFTVGHDIPVLAKVGGPHRPPAASVGASDDRWASAALTNGGEKSASSRRVTTRKTYVSRPSSVGCDSFARYCRLTRAGRASYQHKCVVRNVRGDHPRDLAWVAAADRARIRRHDRAGHGGRAGNSA